MPKPRGCGKTTLAVCLAGYWAAAGERIAVIDADARQQHAAKWLAAGDGALKNITLISSPKDLPGEIGRQAQAHQRVLIDLIGADADVLTLAMANADLVLIPAQDSPLDIDGALTTYRRMKQAEDVRGSVIPVLTRTQPQTALYGAIVEQLKAAGLSVAGAELRNRVVFKEGMMTGTTPSASPRSAAALEIAQLAREVEALAREVA